MNNDFSFLVKTKWLGALAFLAYCVFSSMQGTNIIQQNIEPYLPMIEEKVADFLPITVEGGVITRPQNTRIERSFGSGDDKYTIVLDTYAENLNTTNLSNGIYITRTSIYSVNGDKTEIKSLQNIPDTVVTRADFKALLEISKGYIRPVTLGVLLFVSFIGGLIIIGLYSLVLHWIMEAIYKAPYRQTLRLTTYSYIALQIIDHYAEISSEFTLGFVLAGIVNFAYCQWQKMQNQPEPVK